MPSGLVEAGASAQFCCAGCRTAYRVIHECGLERFYALRDEVRPDEPDPTFEAATFDDARFLDLHTRVESDGARTCDLYLEGVHCIACLWLLERLPRLLEGIVEARLDFRRTLLTVTWDPERVALSEIATLLHDLGYTPHAARGEGARASRRREDRQALVRIGVAGALMGNVMLLAFALYSGVLSDMSAFYEHLFRGLSAALATVALVWPGRLFLKGAWTSIRTRHVTLDVPIAMGMLAAGLIGVSNTIRASGEIYFDTLTMLIFLLLVGRFIQQRQQRGASDALELLFSLTPSTARVVRRERIESIPIESLDLGDEVEVLAGEVLPADGRVTSGAALVDTSLLTGEPRPQGVREGSDVAAGTRVLDATLRVRVSATGEATRIGRLMRLVEEASTRQAPIVRMADRLAGRFVVGVIVFAVLAMVVHMGEGVASALDAGASVLIVACPCALGLATPLAMVAAIGRAARRGWLIKGADSIEALARRGTIFLDKTGTLTEGRFEVLSWTGDDVRGLVGALEAQVRHPIARALATSDDRLVTDVEQVPGAGVRGVVDGHRVEVGSRAFVEGHGIDGDLDEAFEASLDHGHTPVFIAVDGRVAALVSLGDPMRVDAPEAVDRLRDSGWRVRLLSGDQQAVVEAIGTRLGIDRADCLGNATPEDKVRLVEETDGRVVMVGDGVNDAGALARADVGIAMHAGAEASLAASDIYLQQPGIMPVASLADGARRTMRVIRRAILASLMYNLIAVALAVAGLIHPIVAAGLMPVSSLTVLTIAYRSRTFGRD